MPLVSILIPCRNAADTLWAALQSALSQEGVDKEIIVVDDGSTDESRNVARRLEGSGVKLFEGPQINASAARNRALRECHGDYIQYLDADDLLGSGKLAKQVEALEVNPGMVATARWGRFRSSPDDVDFANDDQLHDWTPVEWLVFHCGSHQMMHPAAWLVPRLVAMAAGPWDERLSLNDDGEYFARIAAASRGLKCVPEAETFYRTAEAGSLSNVRGTAAFSSLWLSLKRSGEILLGLEDSGQTRQAVADMLQRFIYEVYPSARVERWEAVRWRDRLGGSAVQPNFGPRSRALAGVLGWRFALMCARFSRKGSAL